MSLADVGFAVLLFLFAMWGWLRGLLRQALALVFLVAAVLVAGRFGSGLEDAVGKVATLTAHQRCVVAWSAAFFGVLLAGAAVQSFLKRGRPGSGPSAARPVAAAVGLAKGVVVLLVGVYALLGWYDGPTRPAFVDAIERSLAARGLRWTADRFRPLVPVPACIAEEIDDVNRRVPAP